MKRTRFLLAATLVLSLAAGILALSTPIGASPPDVPHGPPTGPNCQKPCKPFIRVGDLTCPFVGCFDTGECAYRC